METTNEVKRYTWDEVQLSQPGIENAMNLVAANALDTGASNDRMFLKVSQGPLAGLNLLWDRPSLTWVVKGPQVPEDESTRLLGEDETPSQLERDLVAAVQAMEPCDDQVCLCGAPVPAGVSECHECRKGFAPTSCPSCPHGRGFNCPECWPQTTTKDEGKGGASC